MRHPLQIRIINTLLFSALSMHPGLAQSGASGLGFIAPMDIPLELAGNFMEPRANHFHAGLDLRTQGREGIPVRAVADGWVSRIKISPYGYGKAVYIDHPNGYTTVYGHLQQLSGTVGEACVDQQYRLKDFSIDWTLEKGAIPLKQGEIFALSGNTGGSGGPHLHFEVRRTKDQVALDPETFGIAVPDNKPPEILGVRLYPLADSSRVPPYPAKAAGFATEGINGFYQLKGGIALNAYGTVGLAVHVIDRYNANGAKCGPRSIELFVDSVSVFSSSFDELVFDVNRYCNAHMDYGQFKNNKLEYHRCYRLPHNKLSIYGKEAVMGRIVLEPGQERRVWLRVTDAHGNTSHLRFTLHGASPSEANAWPVKRPEGSLFRYDAANSIHEQDVRFELPAMALYDDAFVQYARRPAAGRAIKHLHAIGDPLVPMHSPAELSIVYSGPSPEKAVVVSMDPDGSVGASHGGKFDGGWVTASVKSFGTYTVMLDTVPPSISNSDMRSSMIGQKSFTLRIADDLSGVSAWRGTLNGEWILMEYDPKTKSLTHVFDKQTSGAGRKDFRLTVTDEMGNASTYAHVFNR